MSVSEAGLPHARVGEAPDKLKTLASTQVRVRVEDENDNSPSFNRHVYRGRVRVGASSGAASGSAAVEGAVVRVSDPDRDDRVDLQVQRGKETCSFFSRPHPRTLNPPTGLLELAGAAKFGEKVAFL